MSTNLTATFDLLLDQAVTHNIPLGEMPTKILILSEIIWSENLKYSKNKEIEGKKINDSLFTYPVIQQVKPPSSLF